MRRLAAVLLLLFLACRTVDLASPTTPVVSTTALATATPPPTQLSAWTSVPPFNPGDSSPGDSPIPASSTPSSSRNFSVRYHPDGPLYVGDLVSLEVISPPGTDVGGRSVRIEFDDFPESKPVEEKFSNFGIGGRSQATFLWTWNTAGLNAGKHSLIFSVQPGGPTWKESVTLFPHGQEPPPEPFARWATTESECCLVYYINGTPVERDLTDLLEILDVQASENIQQFGAKQAEAIAVTFLPRVLGHGGFASQGISMSYLDRNYAGGDPATILHHELTHVLDSRTGGEFRPIFLMEGLAVYLSGGHFKPEALMPRAAALLPAKAGCIPWTASGVWIPSRDRTVGCGLDQYIDFASLIDNFYFEHHEIGYLEAGALVEFMVKNWGWEAFLKFYRDIPAQPESTEDAPIEHSDQYRGMNAALVNHFAITLEQLEDKFLFTLSREKFTPVHSEDLRMTILFYDSVRRYQQLLDPSAYFLTAWLPDVEQMQKRGIVADYLRRPAEIENLALESMLVSANSYLLNGRYDLTASTLEAVNAVLDDYPSKGIQAFAAHSLTEDYMALVLSVSTEGLIPERINIEGNTARVQASKPGPTLLELFYVRELGGWVFNEEIELKNSP